MGGPELSKFYCWGDSSVEESSEERNEKEYFGGDE